MFSPEKNCVCGSQGKVQDAGHSLWSGALPLPTGLSPPLPLSVPAILASRPLLFPLPGNPHSPSPLLGPDLT